MSISIQCPRCLKAYTVADETAGKRLKCRDCGETIVVSGAASPPGPLPTSHPLGMPPPESSPLFPAGAAPRPASGYGNAPPGMPLSGFNQPGGTMAGYAPLPQAPARPAKSGGIPSWVWMGCGGFMLLVILGCGGLFFAISRFANPKVSPEAYEPFPLASVPTPTLPEPPALAELEEGVQFGEAAFSENTLLPVAPGGGARIWLYLPAGEHAPRSLPCVLIAPAGSTMVSGMELSEGDQPEHVPYVKAGFAVLAYELDGPGALESGEGEEMKESLEAFQKAQGGIVNGRNALEFVLAKVPEVDPNRIFAAGHSSAGTVALLLAEHEPRIKACAAFAPCSDVAESLRPVTMVLRFISPKIVDFAVQSSPRTHEARLNCPLFLFHAQDDSNIPCSMSEQFAERLKAQGKDVTLVTVPTGDHYQEMLTQGIPQAIEWFKKR